MRLSRQLSSSWACGSGAVTSSRGLPGQDGATLRDRPDVAGELQPQQGGEFRGWPVQDGGERLDVVFTDPKAGEVVEGGFQTGSYQEAALRWQVAYKQVERRGRGPALREIGQCHGHFIEVGRDRAWHRQAHRAASLQHQRVRIA
jgi:hypothetical protein